MLLQIRKLVEELQDTGDRSTIKVDTLLIEPATELNDHEPVITALQRAHQHVTNKAAHTTYVGWGADATRLNRAGIPTVIYGPGTLPGRISHPGTQIAESSNYQHIPDLITATCVYAMMAKDVCTRKRA